MKHFSIFPYIDLQLCAEGGGEGDGGEASGVNGADAGSQQGVSTSLSDVIYGKQEGAGETADPKETDQQPPDLDAEFEELINGKFKDQYGRRVQDTVQKRLKGTKEAAERMDAVRPILETLARKHGVDAADISALAAAIEKDDSYFEDEAMRRDMTVPQLKHALKLESENAVLRQQMQQNNQREEATKTYSKWVQQAGEAQVMYPKLDLKAELENPQFGQLLMSGIDVKTAYEVIHKDDILSAAMQYTAQQTKQKIANNIRSGKHRPAENGTRAQSSAIVKSDVSKLTDADVEEVLRRVARGEHVSFG